MKTLKDTRYRLSCLVQGNLHADTAISSNPGALGELEAIRASVLAILKCKISTQSTASAPTDRILQVNRNHAHSKLLMLATLLHRRKRCESSIMHHACERSAPSFI
ncbi:hypothetical protein DL546_005745 [Coniochaeta pulveracea]|uniref:Uncharacterized protein n=1 Tax=Coniochaeta pulveracea TaxID=177199 RepID=A0A420Y7C3_9PEZI|nr:hypothetical protein DL546_005745 [Coniochaeta pulveracea]